MSTFKEAAKPRLIFENISSLEDAKCLVNEDVFVLKVIYQL